jgi:hypothetical protein
MKIFFADFCFFKNIFLVCPIWLPVFFLFFYNEPALGVQVGIDPGMALTPLPSSIGLDGDRTHDLPIVSQVLYPYTTAFALLNSVCWQILAWRTKFGKIDVCSIFFVK